MKIFFSCLLVIMSFSSILGDTYTYHSIGDWTDEANWDIYPGTTITSSDTVIINADLRLDANVTINGFLIINADQKFTNDWLLSMNGELVNDGVFHNDSQLNLFGVGTNNGEWTNLASGTLIVTTTASFSTFGVFINNGYVLGYNNGNIHIEGEFTSNENMTINSFVDIKLNPGDIFTNAGFSQFNGSVRIEGELLNSNTGTLRINPSALLIVADNCKLTNLGLIRIDGFCELSSQIDEDSVIGHVIVKGNFRVKSSIPEIL